MHEIFNWCKMKLGESTKFCDILLEWEEIFLIWISSRLNIFGLFDTPKIFTKVFPAGQNLRKLLNAFMTSLSGNSPLRRQKKSSILYYGITSDD